MIPLFRWLCLLQSTILCGSTIEFELACLTMAFLDGGGQKGEKLFMLGNERVKITYVMTRKIPKLLTVLLNFHLTTIVLSWSNRIEFRGSSSTPTT